MNDYKLLLTGYNAFGYLRNQRLGIPPFCHFLSVTNNITHNTFAVRESFSGETRNLTLMVEGRDGNQQPAEYFIKQCPSLNPVFRFTTFTERTFFDVLENERIQHFSELKVAFPERLLFDPINLVHIFRFDSYSENVTEFYHRTLQISKLETDIRVKLLPERLGTALRSWHNVLSKEDNFHIRSRFDHSIPFPLTIDERLLEFSLENGNEKSKNTSLRKLCQALKKKPHMIKVFSVLREEWYHSPPTLLHGDLKHSNILVKWNEDNSAIAKLTLIDWEMACIGDPLWDVAGMIAYWIYEKHKTLPVLTAHECSFCIEHFIQAYFGTTPPQATITKISHYTGAQLIHRLWFNTFSSPLFDEATQLLS